MTVYDFPQYSEEWWSVRLGIPTASKFDKIITTSGKPSTQREKYMFQLAGEVVAGKAEESYQSQSMIRGLEIEDEARSLYELISGAKVDKVGFCLSNGCGASPDSLVNEDGGLEIKCPNLATHVGYLIKNSLEKEYFQQVQGSLFVTGRKWWDIMSYYPGIKPLIIRCTPDVAFQEALKIELKIFCDELQEITKKIGGK